MSDNEMDEVEDVTGTENVVDLTGNAKMGKRWCATWNNYPEQYQLLLAERLKYGKAVWCFLGEEVGSQGTRHLQMVVHFKGNKRPFAVRSLLEGCHVEMCKGTTEENFKYCSGTSAGKKPNDVTWEWGVRPSFVDAGTREKSRWEEIFDLAKNNRISDIKHFDVMVQHYQNLKAIANDNHVESGSLSALTNVWHCGPSGCGKSSSARKKYGDKLFSKPANKWWDGFKPNYHDVVLLDDFEKDRKDMAHNLKIWADHYPFVAETKGSSMTIRPKVIHVTSNYTIDQIFGDDPVLTEAIKRRFKVIDEFPKPLYPIFNVPISIPPIPILMDFTSKTSVDAEGSENLVIESTQELDNSQSTTKLKLKRSVAFNYEDVGITPGTSKRLEAEGFDLSRADKEDIDTALRLDELRQRNTNPVSKVLDMME
jgi:hypothetical protein